MAGRMLPKSTLRRFPRRTDPYPGSLTRLARRGPTESHTRRKCVMAIFFIPLTGLEADSTALNTIANDLSNMNTTAFKAQTTNFSNLFYEQIGETGSGNLIQVGAGTQVSSNSTDFSQGSYNTSGMGSSDMAIDGNGFFIVKDSSGATGYTRDGSFAADTSGNLVTADGSSLMGFPVVNGVVSTSSPLTPISVPLMGQVQA